MTTRRILQISVAIGLMVLLWVNLDVPEALRMLARAQPGSLGAALLALTVQTLLSAWRWRLTARQLGLRIAPSQSVREYYLAQIVNQSLPGGMAGDVGRAVRSRREAGLRRATEAVIIERLAGQTAIIAILLGAAIAVTLTPGGLALPPPLLALGTVIGLAAVATAAAIRWLPHLPGAAGRRLMALRAPLIRAMAAPVLPAQIALSLGTATANLLAFDFCARATGTHLPVGAIPVLVPLILVTMVLPISVSGWGLREGAAAAFFPLAGASATAGLAASIAFGLVFLISTLPGLALLLAAGRPNADAGPRRG